MIKHGHQLDEIFNFQMKTLALKPHNFGSKLHKLTPKLKRVAPKTTFF